MIIYNGPFIYISFNANELTNEHILIELPEGYTYERLFVNQAINIAEIYPNIPIKDGFDITFPVVNSKSPSILLIYIPDVTKPSELRLTIEKFGQIPNPNYFNTAFKPILVMGDDGKEYKVIPSDQFK